MSQYPENKFTGLSVFGALTILGTLVAAVFSVGSFTANTGKVTTLVATSTAAAAIQTPGGVSATSSLFGAEVVIGNATDTSLVVVNTSTAMTVVAGASTASGSYQQSIFQGASSSTSYIESNLQNTSSGVNATTDYVATANNGTASTNYVDLGINSSGYTQGAFPSELPDDAYLLAQGGGLHLYTATNQPMTFSTSGTGATNEAMRITGAGALAVGTSTALTADFTLLSKGTASTTFMLGSASAGSANTPGVMCFKQFGSTNYTKVWFTSTGMTTSTSASCP